MVAGGYCFVVVMVVCLLVLLCVYVLLYRAVCVDLVWPHNYIHVLFDSHFCKVNANSSVWCGCVLSS